MASMNRTEAVGPTAAAKPSLAGERLVEGFAQWQDELLGMLWCVLGNRADAQDALQEAFLKCWRHRDQCGEVENLRAWVFCVTINTGRDLRAAAWRRRRRPLEDWSLALSDGRGGPEFDAVDRERLALLRRAVAALRPEEQEVFLLRQNGQLTYEEIGQRLGIPTGTVKTRMRLALTKLRETLDGREE